jgi:hypothetical protein
MSSLSGAMEVLLQDVMSELQKPGGNTNFCAITVMPGSDVPYDYGQESCGGILWVRLVSATPSVSFPNADVTADQCGSLLAFPLEIGIMRPAPVAEVVGDQFILPTTVEQTAAVDQQIEDMLRVYAAMTNFGHHADVSNYVPGTYVPRGPEGGVVGGIWTLTIGLE